MVASASRTDYVCTLVPSGRIFGPGCTVCKQGLEAFPQKRACGLWFKLLHASHPVYYFGKVRRPDPERCRDTSCPTLAVWLGPGRTDS